MIPEDRVSNVESNLDALPVRVGVGMAKRRKSAWVLVEASVCLFGLVWMLGIKKTLKSPFMRKIPLDFLTIRKVHIFVNDDLRECSLRSIKRRTICKESKMHR